MSAYNSTGSIICELSDDDTQPTERHVCLSFVTPDGTNKNDTSLRFYFENKDAQPIEKHVYLSFITPEDTVNNDASIRFYFENKDEVDEHHQSKLVDPVEPETSMFYNPSAIQDAYDKDKSSSHSIDEILNLCSYKDITGQNTKRTYAETLSAEAQDY